MKKFLQFLIVLFLFTSTISYADCGCCSSCCYNSCCDDCSCSCSNYNNCCLGPCDGYPLLANRSQSRNAAREIVGWQQFINKYEMESIYGAFYTTLEYTRSFRPEYLAGYLFGCDLDCCNTLLVQGSQVENRNSKAWLADYFGLPTDFKSKVSFCPKIQNVIVDLHWYVGLDECKEGLFFKIYAPIVWTKWELNMCECINSSGENDFTAGYMHEEVITRDKLPKSFTESISGSTVFGDMKESLKFGRMTNCKLTKVRLADLRASLGWNAWLEEDGHFGIFVQAAAPTGNRPNSCYLFEPIAGNGKHWELGGGITSSWILWRSQEYEDRYIGVWLDATFTHLFKDCQCRSFDFCCQPNSRYMLLEEMGANDVSTPLLAVSEAVQYQYKKNLIPAINWSTFQVDVKIGMQADIALKIGYVIENWNFDLGYNLWARTGEKFCCNRCCDSCCEDYCGSCCISTCTCPSEKMYAFKGDSFIYGYNDSTAYPLSATQSTANIHTGKNYNTEETDDKSLNPRIDNPEKAFINTTALSSYAQTFTVQTSAPQILVSKNMLNIGKGPAAITHKIFGHFGYAWKDRDDDWIPFVGVGFEVEFAQKCCKKNCNNYCNNDCNTSCCAYYNSCKDNNCTKKRAGVYQYGVWFKSGLSFN